MKFKLYSLESKEAVKSYIDKLPPLKKYDVEIKLHRELRSLSQNRLERLWLNCISMETGNSANYLHEYFKDEYLPREEVVIFGKVINRAVSTTTLSTLEFKYYLDKIQVFASTELGIILPNPDDLHFAQFYEQYERYI